MSRSRRDLHKAKLRRDRIRREKAREESPIPDPEHLFTAERSLWEIQSLLASGHFQSVEEINDWLAEVTRDGRLSERAAEWNRDNPKWTAQSLAYDALETDDLVEALELVEKALKLDPDCTDAQRLMVSLMPIEPANKLHLMREVVVTAERNLGPEFIAKNMGAFWDDVFTRPYMRALQQLAELFNETGQRPEAAEVYRRMLRLSSRDGLGARYWLLGYMLAAGEREEARCLLDRYPDELDFGTFAWGHVIERWLAGRVEEVQEALKTARRANLFAEPYLAGRIPTPATGPDYYQPGQSSEAQVIALYFSEALKAHPGFGDWLRMQRREEADSGLRVKSQTG